MTHGWFYFASFAVYDCVLGICICIAGMKCGSSSPQLSLVATHVDGPCVFWAQTVDDSRPEELQKLSQSLNDICPMSAKCQGRPREDKVSPPVHAVGGSPFIVFTVLLGFVCGSFS